jgi:hypothetical protein
MKRFIAVAGAAILFMGSASAVTAEPRDSVERGTRLDTDCTAGRCPHESPSDSEASLGGRAACAGHPRFQRKSQTQEKRREQSIAPDRVNAAPLHGKATVTWDHLAPPCSSLDSGL